MEKQKNLLVANGLAAHSVPGLSFALAGGSCLALVGPSGSGKSVALRMIADLIPHRGSCSLDGLDSNSVPAPLWRSWVRYLPSESAWWAPVVSDHFRDHRRMSEHLERLGLSPKLMHADPNEMSTGERQRMAFLRALEDKPRVLLLDEPTSALDPASISAVEEVVRLRLADGCAVLLVSHDPAQVDRLAADILSLGESR